MKIWFPMSQAGTGSEIFTRQLAENLAREGFETIVTGFPKLWEISTTALAAFKLRPPQGTVIIHANAATAAGLARFGLPLVLTAHGAFERSAYDPLKRFHQKQFHSKIVRPGIREALKKAAAITAVSSWVANIYNSEYRAKDVKVIHNWIDGNAFFPKHRSLGKKLLFVGRPVWQKGFGVLPELCSLLGNKIELTCTMQATDWHGMKPANVHFIGPVKHEDMPKLYWEHDALVVPSIAEGFCIAGAEAMACGLPVFGFKGHGLDDVLGKCGGHTAANMLDISDLSNRINRVLTNQDEYKMISEQGRQHVLENLSKKEALDAYIEIYQGIK